MFWSYVFKIEISIFGSKYFKGFDSKIDSFLFSSNQGRTKGAWKV